MTEHSSTAGRHAWPWWATPEDCEDYDEATWHSARQDTDGALPRQSLEEWVREQRARRSRDVTHQGQHHASLAMELKALLAAIAVESEPHELATWVFQAEDAIENHPALIGYDRVDAHHRLMLATAAAMQRHRKTTVLRAVLEHARIQAALAEAWDL